MNLGKYGQLEDALLRGKPIPEWLPDELLPEESEEKRKYYRDKIIKFNFDKLVKQTEEHYPLGENVIKIDVNAFKRLKTIHGLTVDEMIKEMIEVAILSIQNALPTIDEPLPQTKKEDK